MHLYHLSYLFVFQAASVWPVPLCTSAVCRTMCMPSHTRRRFTSPLMISPVIEEFLVHSHFDSRPHTYVCGRVLWPITPILRQHAPGTLRSLTLYGGKPAFTTY